MRKLLIMATLCAIAACKHNQPDPPPSGVNIQAPFVRVNVPTQYDTYKQPTPETPPDPKR